MKICEVHNRAPLLPALLSVWEASVRATHLFLSDTKVKAIKKYVPQAMQGVAHLIVAENDRGEPAKGLAGSSCNTASSTTVSARSPSTSRTPMPSASTGTWDLRPISEPTATRRAARIRCCICACHDA